MSLSTLQYMILAGTSYFNQEYLTDTNADGTFDTSNDNEDRIENFLASIDTDSASSTFGAVTGLLGVPGWQEFVFDQSRYNNNLPNTNETFNYEVHVADILKDNPENAGYSFDRSGLDAKIFVESNDLPAVSEKIEVVIAFAGTDKGYNDVILGIPKDALVDVDLSDGDVVDQAYAAIYYVQQANQALESKYGPGNYEISFTGHSLGGHLASVAAAYFGNQPPFTGEAHIFNSAPQKQAMLDIMQELTDPTNDGYVVDDLGSVFPALPVANTDPEAVTIYDNFLTNDALNTMANVDAEAAAKIAGFLDSVVNGTVTTVEGIVNFYAFALNGNPFMDSYIHFLDPETDLDFQAFDTNEYFSNTYSQMVDLGASVPYEYFEQNLPEISDALSTLAGYETLSAKIAIAIVQLHLGSQLLFMLSNREDFAEGNTSVDFSTITDDNKLPWFWVEAFNSEVTGFESDSFQHPGSDAPYSFMLELVRTRFHALGDLGLFDNFIDQIDLLASANLDNLLLTDGSVDDSSAYNIFETVVQHAIMQHSRNQIEDSSFVVTDIVTLADDVLTVDLSLLDNTYSGSEEDYQVEKLLWERVYTRAESNGANVSYNEDAISLRALDNYDLFPQYDKFYSNIPVVKFVESGSIQKLYFDSGNNAGVDIIMTQGSVEQSVVFTGAGADTIEANHGTNLIFSGAGDDVITLHVEKSSTEGVDGDMVFAGQGSDTIHGSYGFSYIDGVESLGDGVAEIGVDTINYSNLDVGVYIQAGYVVRKGFAGAFGVDELTSIENYVLTDQADTLYGYDGLLDETTKIDGGDGFDILDFSLAQSGVTVAIGNSLTVSGFEEVIGTGSDDIISGDDLANRFFGNNGTDYIYANGGDDTLVGGNGSDFLYGGTGNDTYHFSKATEHPLWQQTGADFISDSGGLDDQIIFSGGYQFNPTDFSVLGGALIISTDITVDVADQIENIIYSDGAHYDIARLINDEGAATTGTETDDGNGYSYLDGDASSNSLNATFSTGTINGYAGDDWLYSSSSQNLLLGGDGSDYLFGAGLLDGEDGNDYLDGQGYDNVIYAKSSGIDVISDAGTGGNLLAAQIDEYGVEVSLQYTLWKADNGSLVLDFSLGETSEDVFSSNNKTIILDQFNGGGIEFINGNAIDFSVVRHLSFEADGVLAGTSGIDIIAGGQGNDLISAGALDEVYVSEGKDRVELSSITEETYTVYFPDGTSISDIVAYRDVSDAETINFVHDQGEIGIAAVVNPPTLDFASGGTREVNDFTLLTDGSYEDDEITDFIYSDHLGNLDTARSQDDVIYGRGGDDEITVFNGGVDFVYGGDGDDVIAQYELPNFSTSGSVFFYGEDGNDTLTTLTIAGELYGGDGDDILVSNDMTDKLDGGSGNDWISAGNGSDDIYGGDGNDIIVGLVGGTKTVAAGAGNDLVVMDSTGDDVVSGGDGFDTISFEGAFGFSVSQIDLSLQTAIIDSASYTFLGFEGVIGSYGNDTIIGTVDSNVLDGGTGFVEGFEGNDFLSGGAGSDKYVFGTPYEVRIPPNQTPPANNLTVLVGDDVISDSEGERDAIEFTEYITLSSMVFAQNNDDLVITFDEGSITIQNHFTDGKIEDLLLSGGTRIELDNFSSWLIGTDTDDTLNGSSGNDVLSGGMGNDTLNGGSGNDTYLFNIGDGTNTITDSAGFDIISLGEGLDLSDITFSQVGNDLDIQIASGFLVKDFYSGDKAKVVEELRFADGSTFDLTSLLTTTPESSDAINTASTGFYSYNGSQDKDGMINLIDSATGVELNGNVWKKIAIEYTVTTNTVISFEYKSTIEGELQGFGLETDDDYATGASTYQLYGTDSATNFSTSYTYSGSGDWEHFTIDVGSYQTGDVDWLTFVNDHDGGAKDGNSFYRNIVLYERDPGTANIAPQAVADEFEGLVNTAISGNLFADNFHGQDFDVDSDVINAVAETIATTNGSVVISTNGDFTYTPDTGFSGTDSFIYTVEDGNGGSDTVTATLFVGSTDADQTFTTSSAFEHYNGGAGIDTVDYSTSATRVKLNIGAGIGWDGDANDDTYVHIENVIGTDLVSTGDTIYGSEAENYIWGLAGNDVLEGMGGADTIDGGGGSDYASYSRSDSSVTVNLETGIHTGGDAEGDTLINIEKIIGSGHNDVLTGNIGSNIINAGKGDDILSGGEGNDTLQGDYGSDTYIYTSGHDSIDERGTGTDTVVFDAIWSPDDVVISGNTLTLQNSTVNYISFDDINLIEVFEFEGYAPMDLTTLQTFGAPIQVTGTTNDDTFVATSAAESFDGDSGTDTVDYSNSVSRVKLNLESGTGWDGDAIGDTYIEIENVIGTAIAGDRDFIYGNSADNYISGLAGNDVLEGKAGADTIDGGAGSDYSNYISSDVGVNINLSTNIHTGGHAEGDNLISIEKIEGSHYNDVIIGSSTNNTLIGHSGNDEIRGGDGSDYLYGGNDDDLIYGDAGVDMLYGESGADTFIFEAVSAFSNSDNIQDFDLTEGDKLDVSDLLIGYDPLTDAITDFVQITESSGNSYLNVDVDGGADNFVQVAYIYDETSLTDEDALETSGNLITL